VRSVIRRVNINALYLRAVPFLKQIECLEIFAVNQQPVRQLVQILEARQQPVFELLPEELCVED
jgi:hypothetical protein